MYSDFYLTEPPRIQKVIATSEGCCREIGSYEGEMQEEELVETVFTKSPWPAPTPREHSTGARGWHQCLETIFNKCHGQQPCLETGIKVSVAGTCASSRPCTLKAQCSLFSSVLLKHASRKNLK